MIPVAIPDLSGNETKYVLEAMKSTWISSTGPFIDKFESDFARLCNTNAAITVSNGTVALHLALLALGVEPGNEVIIPSLTYIATANAVKYVGATPVFIDVDKENWCLDPNLIEESISNKTKGIIAVHLYGHPCDMDKINKIAAIHDLWVIEDAAEAHFAKYKGQCVGGLSKMAIFSFYGNKIITCGEGGAITLNDKQLEIKLRMLKGQGMDPERRYYFPIIGYNYRLTNLACSILCAQIERREEIILNRNLIFNHYYDHLKDIPGIIFQPVSDWAVPAKWLYCILINEKEFGCSRDTLILSLKEFNVDTRPFFIPLHKLPPFKKEGVEKNVKLPVTEELSECGINLPTYNKLSDIEIVYICNVIRSIHNSYLNARI